MSGDQLVLYTIYGLHMMVNWSGPMDVRPLYSTPGINKALDTCTTLSTSLDSLVEALQNVTPNIVMELSQTNL